jgi:hypothetical protein
VLTFRAGRDEDIDLLVAELDGGLLERVCLLGLVVDFEGVGADVGLLCSSADLLVAETAWLGPCPDLLGTLVGLLGFGMALLEVVEVGLLGPGTTNVEPELDDDAEELDADGGSSDMAFSTLSSFTGTSITA